MFNYNGTEGWDNIGIKIFDYIIQNYLKILPIFLILGILYQYAILGQYNNLGLFSWGQVVNDTVMIFIPVIFILTGIIIGSLIRVEKRNEFLLDIALYTSLIGLGYMILIVFNVELLAVSLGHSYILIATMKIFIFLQILLGSKKFKNANHRKLIMITVYILIMPGLLIQISKFNYHSLYVKEGNNLHKIEYINDKYIITELKIFNNNGKQEITKKHEK